jgi:selenocysteine lyase/cysteine desulfurase
MRRRHRRPRRLQRRRPRARARGVAGCRVAHDEFYWREIQSAFTLDRTITNLNNGGVCPSPRVVHEAFRRYLDITNQSPVYHMWQILEPNVESVRRQLAADFGCDPEELAITRNASEALQIAQLGLDAVDCSKLGAHLWTTARIIVVPIKMPAYQRIRVTPNVYTTLDEIDTFADIVEGIAKRGSV